MQYTKTSTDLRLPAYKQSRTRSPTVKWRSPFAIMRVIPGSQAAPAPRNDPHPLTFLHKLIPPG